MEFGWQDFEKEKFYQKAEQQLRDAGIDFVEVDRRDFGVRGWNEEKKTVQAVIVTLTPYSYQHFNSIRKSKLEKLGNWQCIDQFKQGEMKPVLMHSRLIITEI